MSRLRSLPVRTLLFAWTSGLITVACSGHEPAGGAPHAIASNRQSIIRGSLSPREQDAVIQLWVDVEGNKFTSCTGSLVAKNLVLTARHCVVAHSDDDGRVTEYAPKLLHVYVGANAPQQVRSKLAPAASGARIFVPRTRQMFPDIALLLLDKSVDAPIASLRLRGGVKEAEPVTVVGFGIDESNEIPSARMQRTGVSVLVVGPSMRDELEVTDYEFAVGAAACSGDSGGPALSATSNAILGVASRVATFEKQDEENPSAICLGSDTEVVYTALQPMSDLVQAAFAAAGATPILEGGEHASSSLTPPPPGESLSREAWAEEREDPSGAERTSAASGTAPRVVVKRTTGCATSPAQRRETTDAIVLALALLGVALCNIRRERRARAERFTRS